MSVITSKMKQLLLGFIAVFVLVSCGNDYVPKPRGYYRIDLPEKEYQSILGNLPYGFEIPNYATFDLRNKSNSEEKYWGDVNFKSLNAKLHISYKPVKNNVIQYINDAHSFVYKHTIKADAISEVPYEDSEKKVYGLLYEIKGDAASNVQFYLTDSVKNFVRGALYFNAVPNKDSLAPVLDFVAADIEHLIETFSWK